MQDDRIDAFRKEFVYSFFLEAIREVAGENADVELEHLEDAFFDAFHRGGTAEEALYQALKSYAKKTLDQARYNQAQEAIRSGSVRRRNP